MSKGRRFNFTKRNDFSNQQEEDMKPKLGYVSDNVMSYYRNVSTSLESGFDDDNDPSVKDNFLTNVYNTLKDEGISVSQNQTVSRILEVLFSHSKPHHMRDIFCSFCANLTIVTFDRFASHVFQSLIQHLPAIYEEINGTGSKQNPGTRNVHGSIEQLCKFTESHMRDVMTDTYGSHVLRSLLEALGGVKVKEEVIRSRISRDQCKEKTSNTVTSSCKSLSRDFQQTFKTLREKIVQLCNFEDHLNDPSYCPVLQTVLLILHKTSPGEYNNLVKMILEKTCVVSDDGATDVNDVSKRLPKIVQSDVGSYLIELIISLASEEQLSHLYGQIFKGNLIAFAVHPIANYVLQKLLSVVVDSVMLKELLSDITQYLEDILAVGHIGIITKLAQACRNTQTGEDDFIKAVLTAFHCQEPVERQIKMVPLIASIKTYEVFFHTEVGDTETKQESSNSSLLKTVNIHGSLLLQQLLQFTKPVLVVSSLLNLSPVELMGLCCDKCGSHVVDTFFQSQTVLDTKKFLFLKKLEGLYTTIACNRNGSRCLESIWKGSSIKSKILIAEELSKNQDRIEGDQWGHFLYQNFALLKFSQRRQEWIDIQGASTKRQQLLNDILQGKARKKKQAKAVSQNYEMVTTVNSGEGGKMNKKKPHKDDTSVNFVDDSKINKKRPHKDVEDIGTSSNKQILEETKQKKKAKLKEEVKSTLPDKSSQKEQSDVDHSSKKKRKRNKDKKRKERHAKAENSSPLPDYGTDMKRKKSKGNKINNK